MQVKDNAGTIFVTYRYNGLNWRVRVTDRRAGGWVSAGSAGAIRRPFGAWAGANGAAVLGFGEVDNRLLESGW